MSTQLQTNEARQGEEIEHMPLVLIVSLAAAGSALLAFAALVPAV